MAVGGDPIMVTSIAPDMIRELPEANICVNEMLDNTGALEILLLGRSGAGKSSFVNAMFDNPDLAPIGTVTAQTQEVTSYRMTVRDTDIKVYDSPGFETQLGFRKRKKYVKAIKEACKTIDYVFLCVRLDDQLQKSDENGLKCLAKGFGSYPEFWKKTTIIFTRANLVNHHLHGKKWQDEVRKIAGEQMDKITNVLTRVSSHINLSEDQYLIAGSPLSHSGDGSQEGISSTENEAAIHVRPTILRRDQYQNSQEWVPHLIGSLLESDSDGIQKIKLLKTRLTKKEIIAHTTLNGSSAVGLGVGIACCVVGAGASVAGPIGPAIGIPLITIGATTIAISTTAGVSTNASFIVKGTRKLRYIKAIAKKESQGAPVQYINPLAVNDDTEAEDLEVQEQQNLLSASGPSIV